MSDANLTSEVVAMLESDPLTEGIKCFPVGSRVTCNPPVMGTDRDILVLCGNVLDFGTMLVRRGWVTATSLAEDAAKLDFVSLRLGEVNIIATDNPDFIARFLAATSVSKRLNLMNKDDRIALFQAVLYGVGCKA